VSDATAFRGQPLLVFAGVLCAWFGMRIALLQPLSPTAFSGTRDLAGRPMSRRSNAVEIAAVRAVSQAAVSTPLFAPPSFFPPRSSGMQSAPGIVPVTWIAPLPRGVDGPQGAPPPRPGVSPDPVRLAVGHNLLLAAGLSQMDLSPPLAAYLRAPARLAAGVPAAAPFVIALPQPAAVFAGSRMAADAWLMMRHDTTSSVVSGRPSYGRSQAGGVVRYRLRESSPHAPQAYLRASSALQGALENDLVGGLSARPIRGVPLRVAAEARISQTVAGTELRPAVIAVTEFPPLDLPRGIRAEAYVQGGYVAGRFATAFVDGQGRVERAVAQFKDAEIAAGAGVWGGAQKGAARLDAGPTAAITFRLGRGRGRLAADYRFRIAGDADPDSGPALTLSAGF
jgi:hypothetical protein